MKAIQLTAAIFIVTGIINSGAYAQARDPLYISPSGNVGINNPSPRALLDIGVGVGNGSLSAVLARLSEGNNQDGGTYLGISGYSTQAQSYAGKSFSIEHSFYGKINSAINFFRGNGNIGGYITINTNNNTEKVRIDDQYVGFTGNVNVSGVLNAKEVRDNTGYVMPKGGIIMWSGNTDNFDGEGIGKENTPVQGWAICNGKGSRPDLTDRFIVGAGRSYKVSDVGGEARHTLSEDEMPSHSHSIGVGGGGSGTAPGSGVSEGYTTNSAAFTSWTSKTGKGNAHENRPPYYALLYIIKL